MSSQTSLFGTLSVADGVTRFTSTSALGILSITTGTDLVSKTPLFGALAVLDTTLIANYTFTSELGALAVFSASLTPDATLRTSQYGVLAVYGDGATADFRMRAWGFTLDGHRFYVLHIGEQGTFVYDFTTQQWSEWVTQGFTAAWNAYVGLNWGADDRILAADRQNPIVWEIDPETQQDEGFKDIVREVTAIIPNSGYSWRTHDSVSLYASVGSPSSTLSPYIELTYSDDQGRTYQAPADSLIVIVPGETRQQLDWMSLGSFESPGRIINIRDYGGVVRIDRATYEAN